MKTSSPTVNAALEELESFGIRNVDVEWRGKHPRILFVSMADRRSRSARRLHPVIGRHRRRRAPMFVGCCVMLASYRRQIQDQHHHRGN
jgi:hypothetical protein